MIKLFGQTDRDFSTNGDIVINPLHAVVHKEDNGDYYLELETNLSYVDYLTEGRILVTDTPQGSQAFRVGNVEKTRKKLATKAYHVYYDSDNYLIADSYVVDKNCNDALDHLNRALDSTSPFTTYSDVNTIASFRCVRKSLNEAVQTVLERWGGHLVRDNFSISILENVGQDNGVVIRYAKNLKEITSRENWGSVVTKLLPVGKDGILLNELDETASIYVTASVTYPLRYTKTVSFDQGHINEEDYQNSAGELDETAYKQALVDDLRNQAREYVAENCVPKVNYTLRANIEKLTDIGDTVEVIDERLGINLITHVIAFDYDCILKKYTEIEFGNAQEKLSNLVSTVTTAATREANQTVASVQAGVNQVIDKATSDIWSVLGNSYVIFDGDKILVVDRLPKENAQNVLKIDSSGMSFSNGGISGTFSNVWRIDGTLDMGALNVVNLAADLISGGTLTVGGGLSFYRANPTVLEVLNNTNSCAAIWDYSGLNVYGHENTRLTINSSGLTGYDGYGTRIFYWDRLGLHWDTKSFFGGEITLFDKFRLASIQITDGNNVVINDGVGMISI